jgi:hypothetical protein
MCKSLGISEKECQKSKKDEVIKLILKSSKKSVSSPKKTQKKIKESPKKKVKKTQSPKKVENKPKTPKNDYPKKSPAKTMKITENLATMTVPELKTRLSTLGIDIKNVKGSGKTGGVLKQDIIRAITDFESIKIGETGKSIKLSPKKVSPKKVSPKKVSPKKVVKKVPDTTHCMAHGKNNCDGDSPICNVVSGKCLKKTKSNEPRGAKTLMKEFGDEYYFEFDEKTGTGIVGKKSDVMKHTTLKAKGKKTKKIDEDEVKHKTCGSSKMKNVKNYKKCDKDEVCDVLTGKCHEPSEKLMKGLLTLVIDDRKMVGDRATIESLQKKIGGEIITDAKKSSSKKASPKKASPKKVVDEDEDLGAVVKKISPKKTSNDISQKPSKKKSGKVSEKINTTVSESRETIHEIFMKCLSELK